MQSQSFINASKSSIDSSQAQKRAKLLGDNASVDLSSTHNREVELNEVEQLRKQLEDTQRQLREKTIEVEKSTQLFTVFDQ